MIRVETTEILFFGRSYTLPQNKVIYEAACW